MLMFRPPKKKEEEKPARNPNAEEKEEPKQQEKPEQKPQVIIIRGGGGPAITSPEARQTTRTALKVQPEREDLVSLGGVVSPNNAGVQIVAGESGKKIKVFDAGYHAGAEGLHYFYFGTSTTATTKRFLTNEKDFLLHKTFVQPRIGAAGDGLYLFSAVAETDMPYDVGYVIEA